MGIILKCVLFFILSFIAAIPLHVIASILGESLGASNVDFVSVTFVLVITSYPIYEYFYLQKKRSSSNNQDKIKAYCRYFKTIRYTKFARGFVIFALSIIIASAFTYGLHALEPNYSEDEQELAFGMFFVIIIVSNFLLRQGLYFGLPEEFSFFDKDQILISEHDYMKIEQDIIDLNKQRRIYILSLLLLGAGFYLAATSSTIQYIALLVIVIIVLLGLVLLLNYIKINIAKNIFPHLTDTKNIQQSFNINPKQHISPVMDVRYPERLKHHFSKNELERIVSETYLTQKTSNNKTCQIWELKFPKTVLMFSIELNKNYESSIFLSTKELKLENYRKISNNTFQFSDIFHLYGEDNVLAYDVMTPVLQENLLELIAGVNAFELIVQIHKDEMLVTMTCGEDLFNIGSLLRPVTLEKINKVIAEIRLIESLPDLIGS